MFCVNVLYINVLYINMGADDSTAAFNYFYHAHYAVCETAVAVFTFSGM